MSKPLTSARIQSKQLSSYNLYSNPISPYCTFHYKEIWNKNKKYQKKGTFFLSLTVKCYKLKTEKPQDY